jgi:inward rectifier potassium channel
MSPTPSKSLRPKRASPARFRVRAIGRSVTPLDDLYHWILVRPWWQFVVVVCTLFTALNVVFALLFFLQPDAISGAARGSFIDSFFFSVETMATIGYGEMTPATRYAHVIVFLEAMVGLLTTATITGVTFAKFARPTSLILFSDRLVVANRNRVPHLMFRLANFRHNQILDAQVRLLALRTERTEEGDVLRRPVEVPLVRDRTHLFALTWIVFHRIDETSLFYGDNAIDNLRAEGVELYISFSGYDETLGQTLHAGHTYRLDQIAWGHRFADVLTLRADGERFVDYRNFHTIEPALTLAVDDDPTPR